VSGEIGASARLNLQTRAPKSASARLTIGPARFVPVSTTIRSWKSVPDCAAFFAAISEHCSDLPRSFTARAPRSHRVRVICRA